MQKCLSFVICLSALVLTACQPATPEPSATPPPTNTAAPTSTPRPTNTPVPPTPIPPTATATKIPPATLPHTIDIHADLRWTSTNVFLDAGQSVLITAIGKVNLGGGDPAATFGPNGGFGPCLAADKQQFPCLMVGAKYGALIGNISNGKPFLAGARRVIKAGQAGELRLGINSVSLGDNTGNYTVRIEER